MIRLLIHIMKCGRTRLPLVRKIATSHLIEGIERAKKKAEQEMERDARIQKREEERRIIEKIAVSHEFYSKHEVIYHTAHPNFKSDMINSFENNPSNIQPLLLTGKYKVFPWIEVNKKTQ